MLKRKELYNSYLNVKKRRFFVCFFVVELVLCSYCIMLLCIFLHKESKKQKRERNHNIIIIGKRIVVIVKFQELALRLNSTQFSWYKFNQKKTKTKISDSFLLLQNLQSTVGQRVYTERSWILFCLSNNQKQKFQKKNATRQKKEIVYAENDEVRK